MAIKPPSDMLADTGRTLYGEHWRMALSRALDVSDDTISRWMSGRTELPPDHGVLDDALELLRRRADEIAAMADTLDRWLKLARLMPPADDYHSRLREVRERLAAAWREMADRLVALGDGTRTSTEIGRALGISGKSVRRLADRLRGDGKQVQFLNSAPVRRTINRDAIERAIDLVAGGVSIRAACAAQGLIYDGQARKHIVRLCAERGIVRRYRRRK